MWIIFCLINTLLCGVIDIIEKKSSKEQPYYFIIMGLLTFNLISLISSLFYDPSYLTNFNFAIALKVLPYCIFISLGYYFSVKEFQNSNISTVSPIMRSKIIFVIFLSFVLLNEKFKIIIYILILLLIVLNVLLTKQDKIGNKKNSKKVFYML